MAVNRHKKTVAHLDVKINVDQLMDWFTLTAAHTDAISDKRVLNFVRTDAMNFASRSFEEMVDQTAMSTFGRDTDRSYSHLYDSAGVLGKDTDRLFAMVFPNVSRFSKDSIAPAQIKFFYNEGENVIRRGPNAYNTQDGVVFREKSKVMEQYVGVWVAPKNAQALRFWVDSKYTEGTALSRMFDSSPDAGMVFSRVPVFVTYMRNYGALTDIYNAYWAKSGIGQALVGQRMKISGKALTSADVRRGSWRAKRTRSSAIRRTFESLVTQEALRQGRTGVGSKYNMESNLFIFSYKGRKLTQTDLQKAISGAKVDRETEKIAKEILRNLRGKLPGQRHDQEFRSMRGEIL